MSSTPLRTEDSKISASIDFQQSVNSDSLRSRLKRQLDVTTAGSPTRRREDRPAQRLIDKLKSSPSSSPSPSVSTKPKLLKSSVRASTRKRQKAASTEQEVRSTSPPPQQSTWEPPVSPFGLIEEQLYHNPWKVFLACILLNRTTATQVRRVWDDLMAVVPDAQAGAAAEPARLEAVIKPLGFHRFRARAIVAMSADFLRPWRRPTELRFVGKYASDAYFIFCRGKWEAVAPEDKDLKRYCAWLASTAGQGTGLARDAPL